MAFTGGVVSILLQGQGIVSSGELVVISVVDGYQHRLPVPHNPDQKSYVGKTTPLAQLQKEKSNWLGMLLVSKAVVTGLPFAHDTWRIGQEEMSRFLERDLSEGKVVLARAPTGYGKTAASPPPPPCRPTSCLSEQSEGVFATARNTQHQMVEDTLRSMCIVVEFRTSNLLYGQKRKPV